MMIYFMYYSQMLENLFFILPLQPNFHTILSQEFYEKLLPN